MSDDRLDAIEAQIDDLYATIGQEAVKADTRHHEVMRTLRHILRLLGAATNGDEH